MASSYSPDSLDQGYGAVADLFGYGGDTGDEDARKKKLRAQIAAQLRGSVVGANGPSGFDGGAASNLLGSFRG